MKTNVGFVTVIFCFLPGICLFLVSSEATAAGAKAYPPINTQGGWLSITNEQHTCHVDNAADKVELSVSGGSDEDKDQSGSIDHEQTRWECTGGQLDETDGATNSWLATSKGSGFVIRVFLNDDDSDPDYDDDESSCAATREVTGFIVGEKVTSTPTAAEIYKRWEDGTTEGEIPWEFVWSKVELALPGGTVQSDTDSDHDTAYGFWQLLTDPYLSPSQVKGDIRGYAQSKSFQLAPEPGLWLWAWDEDPVDNGVGSFYFGMNYLLILEWGYSSPELNQPDAVYGYAAAGLAFGSPLGIECNVEMEDHSDNTNNTLNNAGNLDSGTAAWIDSPLFSKQGRWASRNECGLASDLSFGAEVYSETAVDVKFYIPANPCYIP